MQTATSWLQEQIFNSDWKNMSGEDKLKLFEQAKEMEKQQIIYAYIVADSESVQESEYHALNYYDRTYGSKGSDEHIVDTNEMISSQTEISDKPHSTIIDQIDGIIFELPLKDKIKLYELIEELYEDLDKNQKEISDEDIEAFAMGYYNEDGGSHYVKIGIEWYKEQLKKKQ